MSLTNAAAWKSDPRSLFGTSGMLCRFWRGHERGGAAIEWSFCVFASGRVLACHCSFVPGRAHANGVDMLVEELHGSFTDGPHASIHDNMLGSHSASIAGRYALFEVPWTNINT